jgi:hypothetical protein
MNPEPTRMRASPVKAIVVASMLTAVLCVSCRAAPDALSDADPEGALVTNPYAKWEGFVSEDDPWFFPLAVFTQAPKNAGRYKELGINVYFYLWKGPTAEQIAELKKHDMRTICEFNDYAAKHLVNDPIVLAWTHVDEPDLAIFSRDDLLADQEKAKKLVKEHWPEMYKEMDLDNKDYDGWGFGYGPDVCRKHYERIKTFDKTRPVIIGLSQAILEPRNGRGDRKYHDEDYPAYINGSSDIATFDIYPVAYGRADELWLVPKGVDNLNEWDNGNRPKWCAIECTFGRPDKPCATPEQMRAEIWMAIIHGARGLGFFVHHFDRNGKYVTDAGLLQDPEMMNAVKKQTAEIRALGKVIYAPQIKDVSLSTTPEAGLDFVPKRVDGHVYILASTMTTRPTAATFSVEGIDDGEVEVIGEGRVLRIEDGQFTDAFGGYDVNLYKIRK